MNENLKGLIDYVYEAELDESCLLELFKGICKAREKGGERELLKECQLDFVAQQGVTEDEIIYLLEEWNKSRELPKYRFKF